MLEILAPAKLNLGLEVAHKRSDGFHELRTIFCTISLFDRLSIRESDVDHFSVSDPQLQRNNLVEDAISAWDEAGLARPGLSIHLRKRIPSAAGLGGASSDAAAVLIGIQHLARTPPETRVVDSLASSLGSDVPFFLRGGMQSGSGRGEVLEPLPRFQFAAVVISPRMNIPTKTATIFGALVSGDFTDGTQVEAVMNDPSILFESSDSAIVNSFQRPLYDHYPELGDLAQAVRTRTGRHPSITGAGPSMFIAVPSIHEAHSIRRRLVAESLPMRTEMFCVRAVTHRAPILSDHA